MLEKKKYCKAKLYSVVTSGFKTYGGGFELLVKDVKLMTFAVLFPSLASQRTFDFEDPSWLKNSHNALF